MDKNNYCCFTKIRQYIKKVYTFTAINKYVNLIFVKNKLYL